jgi:alpha-2-macroglobulin
VTIWRTGPSGYVDTKIDTLKGLEWYDSSPYSLAFNTWWDYEGRYDSFLVESRGDGHLGYLVSTWNDGITGYNFGIKDSDYSWQSRGRYTGYLHTDRRLYLPGETVRIHAILRENVASLTIPKDTPFEVSITDPLGREVRRTTYKTNDFWSIALDLPLTKEATLGMYTMSISVPDSTDFIENAYANFQVEVFKNPTFTASVELKSDDISDGAIKDLRKIKNTDPYSPWYTDVYSGNMVIQGIVRAKYYNGAEMKNMPFTYRVYRSVSYPDGYWGDCFWWCYYDPPLELYTEWSGSIDSDGYGVMRIPVEYQSAYDDYAYTVEVTLRDGLSWESVTTPASLVVKLPQAYKGFHPENPLVFTPKKKILTLTDSLIGTLKPTYGVWDESLSGKYRYEILHRDYDEAWVEDIRTGQTRVTTSRDTLVFSGLIDRGDLTIKIAGSKPGEYHMRVSPNIESPPEKSISDTLFYITGGPVTLRDSTLRVIPERTIYRAWETARVMIQVPFTGAYLLITKEKWWVTDREYTYLSGNTLTREYSVDDTMLPNAYIWVVALKPGSPKVGGRSYAFGYAEIVTDIADKKSIITIKPEKEIYKNREIANIDLTLTDRAWAPLEGEVTLMVVDESLIRILGNIDLDIIPKFYQKFPFTVKTALSAIGIERGQYLSRKGSSGWGGNKWWWGLSISSRTLFENTAYYNSSILTDKNGKARISFTLPDNITDYRIIAIANTKDSQFSAWEKTISIRKDYVIEPHVPMIVYGGDTTTFQIKAFNATKKITDAELVLTLSTGSWKIEKRSPISLGVNEKRWVDFAVTIPSSWSGNVSYTVELREKEKILDSITKSLRIAIPPLLTRGIVDIRIWTGKTLDFTLPVSISGTDSARSTLSVTLSDSFLPEFERWLASLIQYPYGCIEQTIASTLPNRVALSAAESYGLSIDRDKAMKNVADGLAKILRMQHISWGWTYWEGSSEPEPRITPYVIRTLLKFRDLGETISTPAIESGVNYILANEGIYTSDMENLAEAAWTLSVAGSSEAEKWWWKIDPSKLSRHAYVAYASTASKLGKYTQAIEKAMKERLSTDTSVSWYWSSRTDSALFAQLLYARGEREKAITYLYPLMGKVDVESYYTSTQEKIQYLLALIAESKNREKIKNPQSITLRADGIIGDLSVSAGKPSASLSTSRAKIGSGYTLRRDNVSPLILITRVHDIPRDITTIPAYHTGGIDISRVYELIDEDMWVDRDGQYRQSSLVSDGVFKQGKLYRAKLTATVTSSPDSWSHLAIEDFFPGAYRPIQKTFDTESSLIQNQQDENWWSYNETKDDRILAHLMYGWGNTRTYTYYFRPEAVWDYLLPPATAYFMYDPDRHAYTGFSRVKVVE